jgi:hypothetical protein
MASQPVTSLEFTQSVVTDRFEDVSLTQVQ